MARAQTSSWPAKETAWKIWNKNLNSERLDVSFSWWSGEASIPIRWRFGSQSGARGCGFAACTDTGPLWKPRWLLQRSFDRLGMTSSSPESALKFSILAFTADVLKHEALQPDTKKNLCLLKVQLPKPILNHQTKEVFTFAYRWTSLLANFIHVTLWSCDDSSRDSGCTGFEHKNVCYRERHTAFGCV